MTPAIALAAQLLSAHPDPGTWRVTACQTRCRIVEHAPTAAAAVRAAKTLQASRPRLRVYVTWAGKAPTGGVVFVTTSPDRVDPRIAAKVARDWQNHTFDRVDD